MSTAVLQPGEIQPEDDDVQRMLDEVEQVLELDAAYRESTIEIGRGVNTIVNSTGQRSIGRAAVSPYVGIHKPDIVQVSDGVYYLN